LPYTNLFAILAYHSPAKTAMFHNPIFSYTVTSSSTPITSAKWRHEPLRKRDATPAKAEQQIITTKPAPVIHHLRHVQQNHYLERHLFF
jgi:hypothetical protein